MTILLLAALMLLAGCQTVIPYDFGTADTQLMVTGFLRQGAPEQVLNVSLSQAGTVVGVKNATLRCYVNETLVATVQASSADRSLDAEYHQLQLRFPADFAPGDRVSVEVEAEDGAYKVSTPQLTVPAPPIVERVDTARTDVSHVDWSEEVFQFRVLMQDRPDEANHYSLHLEKSVSGIICFKDGSPDRPIEWRSTPRISLSTLKDPILLDGNMALTEVELDLMDSMDFLGDGSFTAFSDELFRDKQAKLSFNMSMQYYYTNTDMLYTQLLEEDGSEVYWQAEWPPKEPENVLELHIQTCSQAAYHYLRALRTARSNGYNEEITMAPVTIPSNIIGGMGFVDVVSASVSRFSLLVRD